MKHSIHLMTLAFSLLLSGTAFAAGGLQQDQKLLNQTRTDVHTDVSNLSQDRQQRHVLKTEHRADTQKIRADRAQLRAAKASGDAQAIAAEKSALASDRTTIGRDNQALHTDKQSIHQDRNALNADRHERHEAKRAVKQDLKQQ